VELGRRSRSEAGGATISQLPPPGGTAPVSRFRGRLLLGIHFWDPFGTASRETAPGAAHGAVPNGPKVFFWLLLKDRLNTCNLLLRKNKILPSYNCVLCQL
jgi:hypothetical protein